MEEIEAEVSRISLMMSQSQKDMNSINHNLYDVTAALKEIVSEVAKIRVALEEMNDRAKFG
jgi:septal ring factor EnvC (AmiA/AmiB activator)